MAMAKEYNALWAMAFVIPGDSVDLVKKNVGRVEKLFNVTAHFPNSPQEGNSGNATVQWINFTKGEATDKDMKHARTYITSMASPGLRLSLENFPSSLFRSHVDKIERKSRAFLTYEENRVVIGGSQIAAMMAQSMLEKVQQKDCPGQEKSSEHEEADEDAESINIKKKKKKKKKQKETEDEETPTDEEFEQCEKDQEEEDCGKGRKSKKSRKSDKEIEPDIEVSCDEEDSRKGRKSKKGKRSDKEAEQLGEVLEREEGGEEKVKTAKLSNVDILEGKSEEPKRKKDKNSYMTETRSDEDIIAIFKMESQTNEQRGGADISSVECNAQDNSAISRLHQLEPGAEFTYLGRTGSKGAHFKHVSVKVMNQTFEGMGPSRKLAKEAAAEMALQSISYAQSVEEEQIELESTPEKKDRKSRKISEKSREEEGGGEEEEKKKKNKKSKRSDDDPVQSHEGEKEEEGGGEGKEKKEKNKKRKRGDDDSVQSHEDEEEGGRGEEEEKGEKKKKNKKRKRGEDDSVQSHEDEEEGGRGEEEEKGEKKKKNKKRKRGEDDSVQSHEGEEVEVIKIKKKKIEEPVTDIVENQTRASKVEKIEKRRKKEKTKEAEARGEEGEKEMEVSEIEEDVSSHMGHGKQQKEKKEKNKEAETGRGKREKVEVSGDEEEEDVRPRVGDGKQQGEKVVTEYGNAVWLLIKSVPEGVHFKVVRKSEPPEAPGCVVTVKVKDMSFVGTGPSEKLAKQAAARKALQKISDASTIRESSNLVAPIPLLGIDFKEAPPGLSKQALSKIQKSASEPASPRTEVKEGRMNQTESSRLKQAEPSRLKQAEPLVPKLTASVAPRLAPPLMSQMQATPVHPPIETTQAVHTNRASPMSLETSSASTTDLNRFTPVPLLELEVKQPASPRRVDQSVAPRLAPPLMSQMQATPVHPPIETTQAVHTNRASPMSLETSSASTTDLNRFTPVPLLELEVKQPASPRRVDKSSTGTVKQTTTTTATTPVHHPTGVEKINSAVVNPEQTAPPPPPPLMGLQQTRVPVPLEEKQQADKKQLRPVVIDGNNVAMSHGHSRIFSSKGIQICADYFLARGHKVTAFVSGPCRYNKDVIDRPILDRLEIEGILKTTPRRKLESGKVICSHDDKFILNLADAQDGVIVSNDQYRDLLETKPSYRKIIETRLLPFMFVDDIFMPPDDPYGREGPTLDQLLLVGGESMKPPVHASTAPGLIPCVATEIIPSHLYVHGTPVMPLDSSGKEHRSSPLQAPPAPPLLQRTSKAFPPNRRVPKSSWSENSGLLAQYKALKKLGLNHEFPEDLVKEALERCDMTKPVHPDEFIDFIRFLQSQQTAPVQP